MRQRRLSERKWPNLNEFNPGIGTGVLQMRHCGAQKKKFPQTAFRHITRRKWQSYLTP